MKDIMKSILLTCFLAFSLLLNAQTKNIFLDRAFWKNNPTIEQVEQKISEGNSATALNRFGFDAVVYALLENADEHVIKHLLTKKGNDVNKLTHDGRTYIFWAAYKNNMPIVKYLLANGAKTDVIDDKGYTILNFTAVAGIENPKLYDLLIENGADVSKDKTPKGANALLLIVPNLSDFAMVDYFTAKGLDLFSTDNDGNGAFNYTAQKGNKTMLELLIKKGIPYKSLNKNGGNAMLFATRGSRRGYNSLAFFKYLESVGINPNITNKEGITPLHNLAYSNKDIASFEYFISKGVDVNQADKEGNTALLNAVSRNSLEVIKLLASKTKNINHTNKSGHSALTKSLRNKPEIVGFLLQNKADVSLVDAKGNDLSYHLFNTFNPKDKEAFQQKLNALTTKGLKVSNAQKDGSTLYHLAVEKNSLPMMDFIKKYKFDVNAKNSEGLTALQKAVMTAKDHQLIKYLIAEGAKKDIKTDFGETLFDLAKENEALKNSDISYLK
ncbi:ankyrin repeat domain-containing protein [Tenacibaculum sp. IB213877]|uniref:ankyrin repeat domain-containing protein n=1 Tax=Tenacibaculum sp. IB213877 TaxID=3097351 RepID=UPI002A59913B|nr:ankyrin repeat domain-containing protein [Tenacibaculum sp. IB213877]MDY0779378.1 ankyrin repeat domain-containing protein [Tenacibaculum sp. IB213877]